MWEAFFALHILQSLSGRRKTVFQEHCEAVEGLPPVLSKLTFLGWPIWPAHEAFTDPKTLGKRLSNEGHGFSRAAKWPALDGFRWDETAGLVES